MGCRTSGLSDKWVVGQVGCRTSGLSDKWVVGQVGFVGQVSVGRMGLHLHEAICRRSGLSDMWVVGKVGGLLYTHVDKL